LTEVDQIQGNEAHKFSLEAPNLEELLVSWLNEFLFLFETQELLFSRFDIKNLNPNGLEAMVWGEKYTPEKHLIKRIIKAVTFHKLAITEKNGQWQTQIIYDL
jgi:SHS2 domain-containing protein